MSRHEDRQPLSPLVAFVLAFVVAPFVATLISWLAHCR